MSGDIPVTRVVERESWDPTQEGKGSEKRTSLRCYWNVGHLRGLPLTTLGIPDVRRRVPKPTHEF